MNTDSDNWTIESYPRHPEDLADAYEAGSLTSDEVIDILSTRLKDPKTGGMVIYRTPEQFRKPKEVERNEEQELGLVPDLGLVADGPPCTYCGMQGGHTSDCPVIS